MRVLLTGASGFIGSHVARLLLIKGHEVAGLVRPGSSLWRLQDVMEQLTLLEGDLTDAHTIRELIAECEPDVCIHLAWYAEPGNYLNALENISLFMASLTFLQELAKVHCQHVVAAGTCAEYDTDLGYLREDGPTRPATLYAATKLSLNLIGQQFSTASGMGFAWGRIFSPYGPFEDERRVVPALIRALLDGQRFPATKGGQVRDYLYVEDVASALIALAESRANGVYNISSGSPVTIRQLMEMIGEITRRNDLIQFGMLPYRDWEPMFICGDNQRLYELGWRPLNTLGEGLRQTCRWWMTHLGYSNVDYI